MLRHLTIPFVQRLESKRFGLMACCRTNIRPRRDSARDAFFRGRLHCLQGGVSSEPWRVAESSCRCDLPAKEATSSCTPAIAPCSSSSLQSAQSSLWLYSSDVSNSTHLSYC